MRHPAGFTALLEALLATAGNQRRAAHLIGMPRRTFVSKLRRYRITASPAS